MSEGAAADTYPADELYMLDWWAGWVSWMHWGGGECGGFHGYDKWIKGWHEGLVPHWLQGEIFRMLADYSWFCTNIPLNGNTLEEMQRWTPDAVAELADWVRQGRIEMCDGTYDSPYLFLFPGESQIRQFQYGKAITRAVLGHDVTRFASNEPGFHPQLAQILKLAGYTGVLLLTPWGHYAYGPSAHEHRVWWVAPDGTKIDTIPANSDSYNRPWGSRPFGLTVFDRRVRDLFARANCRWPLLTPNADVGMSLAMYQFAEKALDDTYVEDIAWYAPFKVLEPMKEAIREKIQAILEPRGEEMLPSVGPLHYRHLHDDLRLRFTTVSEYFDRTEPPIVEKAFDGDEFGFRHIAGQFGDQLTISAYAAEARLCDAEAFAAMVQAAGGACRAGFQDRSWKNVLSAQHFNNYCIPVEFCWRLTESPASRAIRLSVEAARDAEAAADEMLGILDRQIDTRSDPAMAPSIAVRVFNPLGWKRADAVTVHVSFEGADARSFRCYADNVEIPCQIIKGYESAEGELVEADVVFMARDVPGFGYRVFHLVPGPEVIDPLQSSGQILSNDLIQIEFDEKGHLLSCTDSATGREFLDTSAILGNELTGRFPKHGSVTSRTSDATSMPVEAGPVRWKFRSEGKLAGYPYQTVVCLTADSRRIDFSTTFDFDVGTRVGDLTSLSPDEAALPENDDVGLLNNREKLRTTFNPKLGSVRQLFSDLAFAAYPSNRRNVLGISWADYSDAEAGLTLINTGNIQYHHAPDDSALLSLVLAYGGPHRQKGPTYLAGIHQFRYSLLPHIGDWRTARSYRHAAEVAHPLIARTGTAHEGTLPGCSSLLEVDLPNVITSALVPGRPSALRVVEMDGKPSVVTVSLRHPIDGARVVDLMGDPMRSARTVGSSIQLDLRAHEIATLELPGLQW